VSDSEFTDCEEDVMTRNDVDEGSVVDLLARIARERAQASAEADREPEVVDAAEGAQEPIKPPTLLFPGAPRRRRR
jgi:hypothetical protein